MSLSILNHIIVGVATYYATSFVQVFFHRIFGRTRCIATLYDVHVGGHHAQYARRLLSDRWIRTERHITWYYAIPFAPMVLTAFWLLSLSLFVVHALSLAFAIWWHVFLHRKYHVRGAWLERFEWRSDGCTLCIISVRERITRLLNMDGIDCWAHLTARNHAATI
jgi:hypothetical protein